jgi:hypothetical protein
MAQWLPLLNYSTKYNISLSTLRRRIKARSIEYRLDQGKYFILDDSQAPNKVEVQKPLVQQQQLPLQQHQQQHQNFAPPFSQDTSFVEASVLTSANRLVEEIKAAYAKILQEKEELISQLKEEVVDLRMLVRVLEESSKTTKSPSAETDFSFGDYQERKL